MGAAGPVWKVIMSKLVTRQFQHGIVLQGTNWGKQSQMPLVSFYTKYLFSDSKLTSSIFLARERTLSVGSSVPDSVIVGGGSSSGTSTSAGGGFCGVSPVGLFGASDCLGLARELVFGGGPGTSYVY